MELQEYVQAALVTEGKVDKIRVDSPVAFAGVLACFIGAGTLLDLYKKNIYYGREINQDKWHDAMRMIAKGLDAARSEKTDSTATDLNIDSRILHGIIGIATEATELIETVYDADPDVGTFDAVNLKEELGDINWYIAILVDALQADWEQIQETNIDKLWRKKGARYDGRFSSDRAINRDVATERKILEGGDARARVEEGYPFGGSDF